MTATGPDPGAAAIASVRIERSGGFAGLPAQAEIAGTALTAAQRKAVEQVSQGAAQRGRAAASAPAPATRSGGADRFHYRVRITRADGQQQEIDLPEADLPAALEGLVKPALP